MSGGSPSPHHRRPDDRLGAADAAVMAARGLKVACCLAGLLGLGLGAGLSNTRAGDDLAAIARDTYIFTFPLYECYRLRYLAQESGTNRGRAAPNQLRHQRQPSDHTSRRVTTPNDDTLYSSGFLDLSRGPLLLEVPEVGDRYYSFAFMDFYTNNFASVGTRTTGGGPGRYLVAGPGWRGSPPDGARLIVSPTNAVWLLGRFLVLGASDLPRVHQLQDQVRLSPLASSGALPEPHGPPIVPTDPWNYFAVVNHALTENPPPARDAPMLSRMALIGVGPRRDFQPSRFDEAQQHALLAGVEEAKRLIAAKSLTDKVVNGWAYPATDLGNFGDDYLLRAATALKGLGALPPAEATYMSYAGEPLDGRRRYRLHFERDRLPPVAAFWSVSIYEVMPDKRLFFADNPRHRYSIGDRTPGLRRNDDGALDVYIQRTSPGVESESNWLPAPPGPFALILRTYLPGPAVVGRTYAPPPVEREP